MLIMINDYNDVYGGFAIRCVRNRQTIVGSLLDWPYTFLVQNTLKGFNLFAC